MKNQMPKGPKISVKTLKRLISYMSKYKPQLIFVFICIILNTVATVFGSVFIKTLIDNYITPLIGTENPDFSALLQGIMLMICVDVVGVITGYFYNRIMAGVSQSEQKEIKYLVTWKNYQLGILLKIQHVI